MTSLLSVCPIFNFVSFVHCDWNKMKFESISKFSVESEVSGSLVHKDILPWDLLHFLFLLFLLLFLLLLLLLHFCYYLSPYLFVPFCSFETVSMFCLICHNPHCVDQVGLKLRDLPASASPVAEIKACAIVPRWSFLLPYAPVWISNSCLFRCYNTLFLNST